MCGIAPRGDERFDLEERRMKTAITILFAILTPVLLVGCEKDRLDAQVKELCAKDGGIKVYETVRLPAEKFDKYGVVRIPSKQDAKPEDEYYYERDTTYLRTGNPEMWRSHHRIIRASDRKVMGESVRYARRGGDIPGPWHESSFGCPDISTQPSLENSIFEKGEKK
jgi:hypothetical protein